MNKELRKLVTSNPHSGVWYAYFEGMNEDGEPMEGGSGETQWEAIESLMTWREESHMEPGPPKSHPATVKDAKESMTALQANITRLVDAYELATGLVVTTLSVRSQTYLEVFPGQNRVVATAELPKQEAANA